MKSFSEHRVTFPSKDIFINMTLELEVVNANLTMAEVLKVHVHLSNANAILNNLQKVLNQSLAVNLANDVMIRPDRFHDVKVENIMIQIIYK